MELINCQVCIEVGTMELINCQLCIIGAMEILYRQLCIKVGAMEILYCQLCIKERTMELNSTGFWKILIRKSSFIFLLFLISLRNISLIR